MGALIVIGTVFLILVCLALIGLVLIQQGKGGGLIALGGGGGVEQAFGVHAATMAQKVTAVLAILFLVLVIVMTKLHQKRLGLGPVPVTPANADSSQPVAPETPVGDVPVGAPTAPVTVPVAPAESE